MQFGIVFANTGRAVDPDGAIALAQIAEEAGFDTLWTVEHVVVPSGYESAYPYSPTGKMPGSEDSPIPDPLIWLTWVAAATRRIKLATGILILPQRSPAVLAKEVATLDVLSKGRVILGVGVGWLEEEFDVIGVPFAERGARTDDHIEALRAFWTEAEPTYKGRFTSFENAKSYPKPVQEGGVPIVIGGHSPPAAKRAGRLGDGFFPASAKFEDLEGLLDVMRKTATEHGRDPDAIEVTAGGAMDVDGAKRYQDIGVRRLVVPALGRNEEEWKQVLGTFGEQVIAKML
ncbi:MAG: LLM class F420-dependent oxidoreductase [Acidimicrobiales bacterium]